jgi:hypothetical protein
MSREMKVSSILTHEVFQEQQSRSGEMWTAKVESLFLIRKPGKGKFLTSQGIQ